MVCFTKQGSLPLVQPGLQSVIAQEDQQGSANALGVNVIRDVYCGVQLQQLQSGCEYFKAQRIICAWGFISSFGVFRVVQVQQLSINRNLQLIWQHLFDSLTVSGST